MLKKQIIQEFFFIRYKDIDPHLRLRFRGNVHLEFYHQVVRAMEKALQETIESGIVHRVQVDTYQRELERYGIDHIALCETLFYYDSVSTLAFITHTGEAFDENLRVAVSMRKIDHLLAGAGFSATDCQHILEELKEQFFQEFGGSSELRHQLNEKYRTYRMLLEQALAENFPFASDLSEWESLQAPLLHHLVESISNTKRLYTIIQSLIHMIINRLFPSKQRVYELVIYHCMAKYYASLCNRLVSL